MCHTGDDSDAVERAPSATTGRAPTRAEEDVRSVRDRPAAEGSPVTSASSEVRLYRADIQADGTVLVIVSVSTAQTYESSDDPGIVTDRHEITLEGDDAAGYSVVEDVVANPSFATPPKRVQRRADFAALAVTAGFGVLVIIAAVLPWHRRLRVSRIGARALVGAGTAAAVVCCWAFTVGHARTVDDAGNAVSCGTERIAALDSALVPYGVSTQCISHSRIAVALALAAAAAVLLVEYWLLARSRRGSDRG